MPRSGLGQAVSSTITLWPGLVRFLDEARIPLDTNLVERGMRPLAEATRRAIANPGTITLPRDFAPA